MLVPLTSLLEEILDPQRAEGKLYKLPHVLGSNLPTGLSVGMSASRPCALQPGQTAFSQLRKFKLAHHHPPHPVRLCWRSVPL